ncbi:MAG: transposase [Rhodospirillaceae bacterium]|nr:transposase [Rhodospirillaceae bacterium]MYB12846.1 transposase [Rhodospirillaceae bacterium]MYI48576.1 transposase [Rhodospirillaceae bacterium]
MSGGFDVPSNFRNTKCNGIESFWSMLKRVHKGAFHRLSVNHLAGYVTEIAGSRTIRGRDTTNQVAAVTSGHDRETTGVPGVDGRLKGYYWIDCQSAAIFWHSASISFMRCAVALTPGCTIPLPTSTT